MILMIDNYDSFTFNLVQYFEELNHEILVKRNNDISIDEIRLLSPDHIVISPGPCTPKDAGITLDVIKTFAGKIPLLGVCLGHQAIGQVFGANVVRAQRVMHGKTSNITHNNEKLFQGLKQPLTVTRYHSLILDQLPDFFQLDAWFNDPVYGQEIMAISHNTLPIFGVQFHPESILTSDGHKLLANFLHSTC